MFLFFRFNSYTKKKIYIKRYKIDLYKFSNIKSSPFRIEKFLLIIYYFQEAILCQEFVLILCSPKPGDYTYFNTDT